MTPAPLFRGSFPGLLRQMLASLIPVGAALCLLVFGWPGWRVFLASAVLTPVVALLALLAARVDRVAFDDEERRLRRPLRRPVPYGVVKAVRFIRTMGLLQVVARNERGRYEILLAALPERDRDAFEHAIRERSGEIPCVVSDYAPWKLSAAIVVLLAVLYGAGACYMTRRSPAASAACEELPPGDSAGRTVAMVHQGDGIAVRFPESYVGSRLTVIRTGGFRSVGDTGRLFLWLAGMRSEHDLFRYAACSRFGLVPLILKAVLLDRWEDVRVLTSGGGDDRVLGIRGRNQGRGEVRLLLENRPAGLEAVVAFAEPEGFDAETFRRLVLQARLEPSS